MINNLKIREIKLPLSINFGAPNPTIIANDNKLYLMFYHSDVNSSSELVENIKERNNMRDKGVSVITFIGYYICKFGYPNDETILGHHLYDFGLDSYEACEIQNSDWIEELKKIDSVHPFHSDSKFKLLKHYVFLFKDSTFECIAEDFSIESFEGTLNDAIVHCSLNLM